MLQRRINTAHIAEVAGGRADSDGAGNNLADMIVHLRDFVAPASMR
jgi:hypothetical protein